MSEIQDDNRALRNTLGRFATGVTIVTAIDADGQPIGLTVNSFSAVSLDPALVLWCLDNSSHNLEAFRHASHHAVNSFSAVSLDPALVLWCLDNSSHNLEAFRHASHHAINVLAAGQVDLSNRFATWPIDRFAALRWHAGAGGAPLLEGCCASFEVANESCHAGGDHTIFVGRVVNFSETPELDPLLFHAGQYRRLAED